MQINIVGLDVSEVFKFLILLIFSDVKPFSSHVFRNYSKVRLFKIVRFDLIGIECDQGLILYAFLQW